jgi:hypothetical protein
MSSEYENIVGSLLAEKHERLNELNKDPEANKVKIAMLVTEIDALQVLYENYNLSMNVFRRAQGGRASLKD